MTLFSCVACGHRQEHHDPVVDRLDRIEQQLERVIRTEGELIVDVQTVAADFDKYKTDVAAAFARLQASIDAGNTDSQALADLDAAINGADADANAEDPAAPPADGGDQPAA